MRYYGYPEYVPVSVKMARIEKKLKELLKKNPDIKPVRIVGRTIARTWWGKAWNKNLESYADYSNRIGRGSAYVRHGAVLDLRIEEGKITALVQGTAARPYSIAVAIAPLNKKTWQAMQKSCENMLESLEELLAGRFPKELAETFTQKETGLFPTPKEIMFSCSCPDWASMCKHVAAALYGAGARLDEDPSLFFTLRKVKMDDLISKAVVRHADKLTAKTRERKKGSKIIEDSELAEVFGIEIDSGKTNSTGSKSAPLKKKRTARTDKKKTAKAGGKPKVKPRKRNT